MHHAVIVVHPRRESLTCAIAEAYAEAVRGLGHTVHVLTDAVTSRTEANWQVGLDLARAAGAIATSTEAAAFDLLGRAGDDDFKALSRLVK